MSLPAAARWRLLLAFSVTSLAACDLTLPWSTTEPRPLSAGPASVHFEKAIDDTMSVVQGAEVAVSGGPPGVSYLCTSDDPRVAEAAWMGAYVIVFPGRPANLGVGTWTTRIWVAPFVPPSQTPLPDWPPAAIDVTYVVRDSDLTFTPASLAFEIFEGMPLPPAQTVRIEHARGGLAWAVWAVPDTTTPTTSTTGWLLPAVPSGVSTPADLAVSVGRPDSFFSAGQWSGRLQVIAGDSFGFVPVTLTTRWPHLAASSAALSFQVQRSQPAPPPQEVAITYEAGAADLITSVQWQGPSGWLAVRGPSTAPGTLTVSIPRTDGVVGQYRATITVNVWRGSSTLPPQIEIPVVLDIIP